MKKFTAIAFCLFLFIVSVNAQEKPADKTEPETTNPKPAQKTNQRPAEREEKKEPFDEADVKTMASKCVQFETGKGNIKIEVFPESAPETVRSFLNLVATGALDTTTFSRVVPDFVIQGGNLWTSEKLTDDLKWRAAETLPDEPSEIRHEKGILSMARGEEPNTASTNFFILLTTASYLDNKFAAFGRVTEGMETVETINKMPVEGETPKDPVRITKATIIPCSVAESPDKSDGK